MPIKKSHKSSKILHALGMIWKPIDHCAEHRKKDVYSCLHLFCLRLDSCMNIIICKNEEKQQRTIYLVLCAIE